MVLKHHILEGHNGLGNGDISSYYFMCISFQIRFVNDTSVSYVTEAHGWPALGTSQGAVAGSWVCLCQRKSRNSHAGQLEKFWLQRARQARARGRKYRSARSQMKLWLLKMESQSKSLDAEPKRWLRAPLLWKGDPVCSPHSHWNDLSKVPIWFSFTSLKPFMGFQIQKSKTLSAIISLP